MFLPTVPDQEDHPPATASFPLRVWQLRAPCHHQGHGDHLHVTSRRTRPIAPHGCKRKVTAGLGGRCCLHAGDDRVVQAAGSRGCLFRYQLPTQVIVIHCSGDHKKSHSYRWTGSGSYQYSNNTMLNRLFYTSHAVHAIEISENLSFCNFSLDVRLATVLA